MINIFFNNFKHQIQLIFNGLIEFLYISQLFLQGLNRSFQIGDGRLPHRALLPPPLLIFRFPFFKRSLLTLLREPLQLTGLMPLPL